MRTDPLDAEVEKNSKPIANDTSREVFCRVFLCLSIRIVLLPFCLRTRRVYPIHVVGLIYRRPKKRILFVV